MSNLGGSRGEGKKVEDYLFYQEGGITIYKGDCMEIMPMLDQVDLVVMDPPYGMNFQSNHREVQHRAIHGDDKLPLETIKYALALANRGGYVFCRWDNLAEMPKPKSCLAWIKNNWSMGDLEHEHGRMWEACLFYAKTDHKFRERIPDVIKADRTGNELHPTQKPVSLISRIIACNVGEVVLDPFMGSGTTLVACKELKRTGIGIEIDEKYCQIAVNRLKNTIVPMF